MSLPEKVYELYPAGRKETRLAYDSNALLPLLALVVALILTIRVWRFRARNVAMTFIIMMLALAWWSLTAIMEYISLDLSAKIIWIRLSYFGITVLPVAWLAFTLRYTGRDKWLTRRNLALLAVMPAATLVVVWTNDLHHLMWKDIWLDTTVSPPNDAVTHNTWFWIYAAYAYSLLLLGTVHLFTLLRRSGIYRKQGTAMLLAALVPWAGNIFYIAGIGPFSKVDPTPLAFAVTGIAFYWGLSRLQLLDIMPVAQEAVFKSMADGVVVLDAQLRIADLNPAAQRIVGRTRADIVGRPYSTVLPGQAGMLTVKSDTLEAQATIALGKGQEQRHFGVYISPILSGKDVNGHVLLLHDDTERRNAELESKQRSIIQAELAERTRAQEKLRQSEEKYSTIVEDVNDGIIILQDGIVQFANSKMAEVTGFPIEQTVGKPLLQFLAPEYREIAADRYRRMMAGQEVPKRYEMALLTRDGGKVPVEVNASKTEYQGREADLAIVRDITERERAEQTLRASEAKFRNLVEHAAAGIAINLPDGQIVSANGAMVKIFGFNSETELAGTSLIERYVDPEDRRGLVALLQTEGVAKGFEVRMKRKDGGQLWASLNVIIQTNESGQQQFLSIVEDITERREVQEKLARLNEELMSLNSQLEVRVEERTMQLERAVREANGANQAKSDFLASMSHELRTPLNAIIGFSEMLQEQYFGPLNDKQKEYVSYVYESGEHLLSLINDILDLSKIEAGKIELELALVDIKDLLESSLVMIKEKAASHGIKLTLRLSPECEGLGLQADQRRLKQVMFNLLSNAAKFTPDGGAITVEVKKDIRELVVSVTDTGIGIPLASQSRIFEEFFQVKGGITGKTPGTGLGLAITRRIVNMHRGRIWFVSEGEGKGTTFFYTLPLEQKDTCLPEHD